MKLATAEGIELPSLSSGVQNLHAEHPPVQYVMYRYNNFFF